MIMHPFNDNHAWLTLKTQVVALAKQHIMPHFTHVDYALKADGSLLTLADTAMQQAMKDALQQHWPQFTFVGEESDLAEQQQALTQDCWILDPIDGTTNFANGVPFFSVSLALKVQDTLVAGLVYDPARDELFAARLGYGAELNHAPLKANSTITPLQHSVGVIDFKRLKADLATRLATQAPYASQRSFGSVALDWCWIAAGRGHVYLHGNQSLWDYAAGWLILNEAGGASCSLDGSPVLCFEIGKRSAVAAYHPQALATWYDWISR
jgi:myo-inositol-1(or 4)-monophosphatase